MFYKGKRIFLCLCGIAASITVIVLALIGTVSVWQAKERMTECHLTVPLLATPVYVISAIEYDGYITCLYRSSDGKVSVGGAGDSTLEIVPPPPGGWMGQPPLLDYVSPSLQAVDTRVKILSPFAIFKDRENLVYAFIREGDALLFGWVRIQ